MHWEPRLDDSARQCVVTMQAGALRRPLRKQDQQIHTRPGPERQCVMQSGWLHYCSMLHQVARNAHTVQDRHCGAKTAITIQGP